MFSLDVVALPTGHRRIGPAGNLLAAARYEFIAGAVGTPDSAGDSQCFALTGRIMSSESSY